MTKLIAYAGLVAAGLAVMLGNYWYTFGLWPQSWLSFFGFGFATIVLMVLRSVVQEEK